MVLSIFNICLNCYNLYHITKYLKLIKDVCLIHSFVKEIPVSWPNRLKFHPSVHLSEIMDSILPIVKILDIESGYQIDCTEVLAKA